MSFIEFKSNSLICTGGMSTEVAFTKYVADRSRVVYGGWENVMVESYPKFLVDRVEFVVETVKQLEPKGRAKGVLYSPGFLSVPYITTFCDWVYLPSHFLVCVNSIRELREILQQTTYECYAIAGYDGCLPDCIVAWIKFVKLPPPYVALLEWLGNPRLAVVSVWDRLGRTSGENIARAYERPVGEVAYPAPGDIYLMYVNECYTTRAADEQRFTKLLADYKPEHVSKEVAEYITDWESGIDAQLTVASDYPGEVTMVTATDSLLLYDIASHLSRQFMYLNAIPIKGIVLNEYMVGNPRYETFYGYLPFVYWQGNSPKRLQKHFEELVGDLECDELWLTGCATNVGWVPKDKYKRCTTVFDNSQLHDNLRVWIQKYRPDIYPKYQYINWLLFEMVCRDAGLNVY